MFSESIELGDGLSYYGISDSNLQMFCGLSRRRTKFSKLIHIGWEHYMTKHDEYREYRDRRQKEGHFRREVDFSNMNLVRLK
jgi:hypothetical protein